MNVLQLCLRVPDPPGDGGTIAMNAISRSLMQAGAKLKILSFNTKKHFTEAGAINEKFRNDTSLETVYLDTAVRILPAFVHLFKPGSYNIGRFSSPEFNTKLKIILEDQDFDIVHLESLFLAPYVETIRRYSKAKIVLRAHNIEYLIWQRMAHSCRQIFKKWYLSHLAKRLRTYEIAMMNSYDAIVPITEEDAKIFRKDGCHLPIHVCPLGLDLDKYRVAPEDAKPFSVFHLGSMDWMPNQEAVYWFLEKVWKVIRKTDPGIILYLAGKNMPESIRQQQGDGLEVEDYITDAVRYMAGKTVMVVPLLSGSGMRVKIMEGMALGKTVISTRIGAEGIACTHMENILLADTPEEFVHWILECRRKPDLCRHIGQEAWRLVASRYDNSVVGRNLYEFYLQILKG